MVSISLGFPALHFLQPEERLTAIRGTTQWSSHSRGCGPLGRIPLALGSLSPEAMPQPNYGWSLCAASRRSRGPTVSSVVKGAIELSGRITNGRCCFKTAYMRVVNL